MFDIYSQSPIIITTAFVATISALLLAAVYTRPRMHAYAPTISAVRMEPIWQAGGPRLVTMQSIRSCQAIRNSTSIEKSL